jgi:hypothetical protein
VDDHDGNDDDDDDDDGDGWATHMTPIIAFSVVFPKASMLLPITKKSIPVLGV